LGENALQVFDQCEKLAFIGALESVLAAERVRQAIGTETGRKQWDQQLAGTPPRAEFECDVERIEAGLGNHTDENLGLFDLGADLLVHRRSCPQAKARKTGTPNLIGTQTKRISQQIYE
jgi:hypothetical protein